MSEAWDSAAERARVTKLRAELVEIAEWEKKCRDRKREIERELRKLDLKPQIDEWARILEMPDRRERA